MNMNEARVSMEHHEKTKGLVVWFALLLVVCFTIAEVVDWLDTPQVYQSNSTGRIVAIKYPNGKIVENPKPDQLPVRYDLIWVR